MGHVCSAITLSAKLFLNVLENADLENDPEIRNTLFLFPSQLVRYFFGSK